MNSLSSLWNHFEFTFMYANLSLFLRIHYLLHEFTMDYLFCEFRIDLLSSSWRYSEFTINFANLLWIHYLFRQLTMYWLYFALNHYELTIFFHENTVDPLSMSCIHNFLCKFTINPRNDYKFTIFFVKSLWIHIHFRKLTFNSFFLQIHYQLREFIMNLLELWHPLNSLWLHYLFIFFCLFNYLLTK